MKKFFLFAMAALVLSSCDKEEATADSSFAMKASGADYADQCTKPRVVISGDLTAANGPHNWTNNNVYVISGVVRVKTTLNIQAGTYIIADSSITTGANGVLAVTKAGTIEAVGLSDAPIVFTSWKLLDCNAATVPAPGDFGGVVLLGEANVNNGSVTNIIEGLGDQPTVSDFYYGGSNDADYSGTMKYVRIEYAGRILNALSGVEINGLTLGAVGNTTNLDYIQVTYGRDDAFEFFGGTVNAGHLIAFGQDDDGLDFDLGYTGTITKALVLADKNSSHSTSGSNPDTNGIELDNNAGGTLTTLITKPRLIELSIIGVSAAADAVAYENGIHVRRRGQIELTNATVTGYNTGILWENSSNSFSTDSSWSNFDVHGFVNPTVPATALGFGSATSTSNPATPWSLTQPFFNNGTLNFAGGTGAFTNGDWASPSAASWVKYSGF